MENIEYNYDPITKVYTGNSTPVLDKEETIKQNKIIFAKPRYGTFTPPPEFSKNEIPAFNEELQQWDIIKNYRGEYQINLDNKQISIIDYYGDVKDGFVKLSNEEFKNYSMFPEKYLIIPSGFYDITNIVVSSDTTEVILAKTAYRQGVVIAKYNELVEINTEKYNLAMNTKIELNNKFLKPMFIQKWATIYTDGIDDISMGVENPKCNYSWYQTEDENSYKLFENIDFKTEFLEDFRAVKPITKEIETKYQKYLDCILSMYRTIQDFNINDYENILQNIENLITSLDYGYNGSVVFAGEEQ